MAPEAAVCEDVEPKARTRANHSGMSKIIVLMGAPGAGKGTQARLLQERLHLPQISTGDIFRALKHAQTPLAQEVREIMERGQLVPDELTIRLVKERTARDDCKNGYILDGFPRTLPQSDALDEMLADIGKPLDAILFFQIGDEAATERLLGRAHEEGRSDDTPEVIARRLEIYHQQTEPVVEHYRLTGKLVPLHAERSVNEVWAEVQAALERL
mgnify:CR=1 FL=1